MICVDAPTLAVWTMVVGLLALAVGFALAQWFK